MEKRISLLKYCKLKNDHGFTLVEMLIASVILSLVISTVYFTYRTALNNSHNLQNKIELYQNAQAALDSMSTDLRGAFRELKGAQTQITFITSHSQPFTGDKNIGLAAVKYSLGNGLVREEKLPEGIIKELQPEVKTATIAPLVTALVFSYGDGGQWYDSWDSAALGNLPSSIKIIVQIINEDKQYPEELTLQAVTPIFCGRKY